MKNITFLTFLLAAVFYSCEVEEIGGGEKPLPPGVTRLSATVRSGVKTRAVGDLLNDATKDEKRVDRLAFFVHTEAEGMQVYEPAAAGETYKDFPNKVILTPIDPADPSQGYTATVDLTAGAGYDADVIAVANLPEDYDYKQVVSWQGLLDSVAVGTFTDGMPLCTDKTVAGKDNAFVMCGVTTVPLRKEKEETFELSLERLTARIDVTNEAYEADPDKGFQLTSVRILHARPQSYIVPQMDYVSPDVQTVSDWMAPADSIRLYKVDALSATDVTAGSPDEQASATCQRVWHSLYTYENHDTDHAPTNLEIKGTFRGRAVTRQIPFEVMQADGSIKPVPVIRNHRYLVVIKQDEEQTDIEYQVTVGEWNAVDTVNVTPNQLAPVLSKYASTDATKAYGTYNASVGFPDTIVIPATGGTFTFTASCPFDTKVTFGYASDDDKGTGDGWLSETHGDPVYTKADAAISREFTVTIANDASLDAHYVNRAYMYVANAGNGSAMDTVTIYQGADIPYAETRFAAATAYGVVWAPLNCGATELTGKDEKITVWTQEKCGYFYQWGRNVPFVYGGAPGDVYSGDLSTLAKYPNYNDACKNEGVYANKFIKGNLKDVNYAWFKNYTFFTTGDNVWPRENQPCPAGWRVSSKAELQKIKDTDPRSVDGKWVSLTNDRFILPSAGYTSTLGISSQQGTQGCYWSSSFNQVKKGSERLTIQESGCWFDPQATSLAFPIRCVKE